MSDLARYVKGVEGHAFAARSSHRQPAQLSALDGGTGIMIEILSTDGTVLGRAPLDDVVVDPALGRAPRKLTLPDGTVFETEDHLAIEVMEGPTAGGTLHRLEAFSPRLIAVVGVCFAAAWLIWRYGLDLMVAGAIMLTPPVFVEQIDKGSMRTIDFTVAKPSTLSTAEQDEVREIYQQLVAALPERARQAHSFDLQFRHMPGVGPNAFALPGGTMVMTDTFLMMFPEPDVVAGVLGHEIGHVVEQHGLKRIYRSLGLYALIAFTVGDTGPILEDIILEGNLLLSLSFSRAQETSADKFGLRLSNDAGFDPAGLKTFFEKMHTRTLGREPSQWLSTHPSSVERLKAIDAFIADELQAVSG